MTEAIFGGDFRNRRITVMGLGTFGGGIGAVRFLSDRGACVRISDQRTAEQLKSARDELTDVAGLDWKLGPHDWSDFADAELVVVNPAVKPDHPLLDQCRRAGIPLSSEMNLFWQLNRGRVVAVTGSNGKSTTTALTHSLLQASGQRCWLGGNIGHSLLPIVDQIQPDDWVVLELSSFQLHQLNDLKQSPRISIVTNFAPNHLDWHPSLDHYRSSKQTILRWQTEADWAILNGSDADVRQWPTRARRVFFATDKADECCFFRDGRAVVRIDDGDSSSRRDRSVNLKDHFPLPGPHNQQNALAAIAAAVAAGVTVEDIERGLRNFKPLPHRLELVAALCGVRFFNDSIATTPESAICALHSFDRKPILLAGGYDKHVDLTEFARAIAERAAAVVLLGQTGSLLGDLIERFRVSEQPQCYQAASFDDAFDWATQQVADDDIVVLSPGCASYDWFRNFVDRGDQFSQKARDWCAAHCG